MTLRSSKAIKSVEFPPDLIKHFSVNWKFYSGPTGGILTYSQKWEVKVHGSILQIFYH